jgi:quinoprotein glucose dehydrogenase
MNESTYPMKHCFLAALCLFTGVASLLAGPAEDQVAGFRKPGDVSIGVFAYEGQLNNPVAICVDPKGRLFAAESLRQQSGVYGTAGAQKFWTMDDYTTTRLEQRLAMYSKWEHKIPASDYTRIGERIRLLEDTDGDGRADKSVVFADGFNDMLDGAAAGVAELDGKVYFTCSPGLWMLPDEGGKAGVRKLLHRGFGIRVGIHGHDMHAPVWGPDGRLYFNVGDRGFHVELPAGKVLSAPHRGGVFRCEPDGGNLELFHKGVRNPQGMAFNEVGDLFTVDNNMGGGDKSRVLHLVEGADSGWDAGFQLSRNFRDVLGRESHGIQPSWFTEGLYEVKSPGRPAWVNPASGHLTAGPSGLDYYPGIGLPDRYRDHFFVCDFRGGAANSGIYAFQLKRDGAGYILGESEQFLWNILATDCTFGFDGRLYVVDWISGWRGAGKGRIYTLGGGDQGARDIVARGFDLPKGELAKLLGHPHSKVRLRAQYSLAKQGAVWELSGAVQDSSDPLKRLHGIWGLGQIARKGNAGILERLPFGDPDEEVRAQVAKVVGDARYQQAAPKLLLSLSEDPSARVKYFAATALGKLGYKPALEALVDVARNFGDEDPVLGGACVRAIATLSTEPPYKEWAGDPSPAVRRMAVLVLRELGSPGLLSFLEDPDPSIVLEAARAIHDVPVQEAMPGLAKRASAYASGSCDEPDTLVQRTLNANFRIGSAEAAARVAAAAANPGFPEAHRREALAMLRKWQDPLEFDRVLWTYRPFRQRCTDGAGLAVAAYLQKVIASGGDLAAPAILAAAEIRAQLESEDLLPRLEDPSAPEELRLAALEVIARGNPPQPLLRGLAKDNSRKVAKRALEILSGVDPEAALSEAVQLLEAKDARLRQIGFDVLGRIQSPGADKVLLEGIRGLDSQDRALHLEILEACRDRPALADALDKALGKFGEGASLEGGDAARGKYLFFNHSSQCMRCHKHGKEGGLAGPDLTGIGKKKDRVYLLESLLRPQASIAPGYGVVQVTLVDGSLLGGILIGESDDSLEIRDGEGKELEIPRKSVRNRTQAVSAMPPMGELLTKRALRDLVEFLATE